MSIFDRIDPDIPEDVWEELSFKQCADVCLITHSDKLRLRALKRMREIGTFKEWRNEFFAPLRNHIKLMLIAVKEMWTLSKKSGKTNQIERLMKDAFAIGRLAQDFNRIGYTAKEYLSKNNTRNQ
ncbi:MAG: hypothetical protein V1807_00760 [Patescibacteria group bacterium]